ncbi:MAG: SurA N-terminal domain-containing protein [Paramuribaculum sp.]|nr:SurA N-terminal domain-containing protein [Paramuribaculum sp.]
MATLEKIRSKSVLLLIIIGVALLAFIIGDFFNSSRSLFGPGSAAAKVDGVEVDINQLNNRVNDYSRQASARGNVDNALVQNQMLSAMMAEQLAQKAYDELGLKITDEELSDIILGRGKDYANYLLRQQGLQIGVAEFYDMVTNPAQYQLGAEEASAVRQQWAAFENQVAQDMLARKFMGLLGGTLVPNELDAKAAYADINTTYTVEYVVKPYSTMANNDERFNVSEEEIKKEWKENRSLYKLPEEVRTISYINVDIRPSEEDLAAARTMVEETVADLKDATSLECLSERPAFVADRQTAPVAAINDAAVRQFADTAAVGSAAVLSNFNNNYVLGKLFSRHSAVDSVCVDMVAVVGTPATVDSVLTAMTSGADVEALKEINGVAGINDSIWVSAHASQFGAIMNSLQTSPIGVAFVADSLNQANNVPATLMRVTSRKAAQPIVDVAVVTTAVRPSENTIFGLQDRLQEFIYANNNAEAFVQNAQKAGYVAPSARVSLSTPQINGLPDSQNLIYWAMKADKGKVSNIFGDDQTGHYMVAAVTDVYDEYLPATDPNVHAQIEAKLRNDKKAKAMLDELNGKATDVAGYATAMSSEPSTVTVNFVQPNPYLGAKALAAAATAGKGAVVGPMADDNGVVVFRVMEVTEPVRPYNYTQDGNTYSGLFGLNALVNQGLLNAIFQSDSKVKNNLPKFYVVPD